MATGYPANFGKPEEELKKKGVEQFEDLEINKQKEDDLGKPRYGDRRISDDIYKILRKKTPSSKIRKMVNKGIKLPMPDPVLPGKMITKALQVDHIVSMDRITRMEGFNDLTFEQQVEILNYPENFVGISEAANKSKGPKSYSEWTHYKKGKKEEIEVNNDFRQQMIEKEKELEKVLQRKIDDLVKKNGGKENGRKD